MKVKKEQVYSKKNKRGYVVDENGYVVGYKEDFVLNEEEFDKRYKKQKNMKLPLKD